MNQPHQKVRTLLVIAVLAHLCVGIANGDTEPSSRVPMRQWFVDISLVSYSPDDPLATYKWHGGGGVGPTGTTTLQVAENESRPAFTVTVRGKSTPRGMVAELVVEPPVDNPSVKAGKTVHDTWDLASRSVEIAHDEQGRIYRLNLVPRILEEPTPDQFSAEGLKLDHWKFARALVVVNDEEYAGDLDMTGGPIAWLDISGVGKVEFSLRRLSNASPTGRLQNGVLELSAPNDKALRISGVVNGNYGHELIGGPYRVWARWQPSEYAGQSGAIKLQAVKTQAKAAIESGELPGKSGLLKRIESAERGDPVLMAAGVRGVMPGDLEDRQD